MNQALKQGRLHLDLDRSWLVIAGVVIVNSVGAGVPWYAMGILFSPLMDDFGWGRGPYSVATSIFMTLMTASSAPVGRAVDRWGSRRVMLAGAAGSTLAWGLISQVGRLGRETALWQVYLLYAFLGIATASLGNVPTSTLVARWFRKNRGVAMGLSIVGSGLPGVILVPLSVPIIDRFGWRGLTLLFAVLVAFGALPSIIWLLREPPGRTESESEGFTAAPEISVREALRQSAFWVIAGAFLLGATTSAAIQVHAIPFLMDRGLSRAYASYIWGFLALVGTVGKLFFGWVADRVSAKVTYGTGMTLQAVSVGIALTFLGLPGAWAFALLFGLGMGGLNCSRPLLVAERFDVRIYGTALGLLTLLTVPGRTGGQLLAGYLYDLTGSYRVPYSAFIVASLLGLGLLLLLPQTRRQPAASDSVERGAA